MKKIKNDVVIIGGGPAGLAAAVALHDHGVEDIIVLEREKELGGILRQCIHDGFGLQRFSCSLTGPEYAQRFIDALHERRIPYQVDASVMDVDADKTVRVFSSAGVCEYLPKAIVFAMGCRERTRGNLAIPGDRPSGVYTAGVAQNYLNIQNLMVGREAVILGSGDIGLIMARRLSLEGAHVQAVMEIKPYPGGLARNRKQCLDDFGIPLLLSHTVTQIHGRSRLEGITAARVNEQGEPIAGTEQVWHCDTLIISAGLIPENELSLAAGVTLDAHTGGPRVDAFLQTDVPGIFAAGNVLHIHDLVDGVSEEAERLADSVCAFIRGLELPVCTVPLFCGEGVLNVVPQCLPVQVESTLALRVSRPCEKGRLKVRQGDRVLLEKELRYATPSEMIFQPFMCEELEHGQALEVSVL